MGQILEAIREFFEKDEWPCIPSSKQPLLRTNFSGENAQWTCFAQERTEQEQAVFYSVCPIKVPEEKRPQVAEFITRANYGMIIGNFEMDYSDGEIRYKTSVDVEGEDLTQALINGLTYSNVSMMDRYMPGIMRVIFGGISPEEAVAEVENK